MAGHRLKVIRQRLSQHEHPGAVADALRAVPRSRPFGQIADLGAIAAPTAVVASDDEPDPGHPREIGEAYAAAIPGAQLVTDRAGALADRVAGEPAVEGDRRDRRRSLVSRCGLGRGRHPTAGACFPTVTCS